MDGKRHEDRRLDAAAKRAIREQETAARRRSALRILDAGGTIRDAARAGRADENTVKRWVKERGS